MKLIKEPMNTSHLLLKNLELIDIGSFRKFERHISAKLENDWKYKSSRIISDLDILLCE